MNKDLIGKVVAGCAITDQGEPCAMTDAVLIPVRLADGTFRILVELRDGRTNDIVTWDSDNPEAKRCIESSSAMPTVLRGFGSDVIHVHASDAAGSVLVKLFYNAKKVEQGRIDEVYR